jgi:alpha-beta hydrolase superfamily lysophospholipase
MFSERHGLESPTGSTIAWHRKLAADDARAVVLISHGLAEHSRRYEGFAEFLAENHLHTYALDHRGHGETVAQDAPLGQFAHGDGPQKVMADIKAMRDHIAALHPGLPVILFGHSMGGLISFNTVLTYPQDFAAVTIWNSNFFPGPGGRLAQGILAAEKMFLGSDVPSRILPRLTFDAWGKSVPGHRTLFDWLSHDPAEVDRYIADPLCGFDASISLWIDIFHLTFRGTSADLLSRLPKNLPVQLVGGGQDPATDNGKAIVKMAKCLAANGFSNVSTSLFANMRHESLNEINRQEAMTAFSDWCNSFLPPRTIQSVPPLSATLQ